jgi:large subunit ribosomal protein L18
MRGNRQRSVLRRRKAGLTDYRRRLRLLRSEQPRAVVRVSNTRTSCQLVTWAVEGDKVALNVTGNDLVKKFSWPDKMSKKSVPASYLVGYALGKAAIAAGHEDAVLDIGLAASTPGSRVFAALRGMVEAGLNVPHSEEILPDDDRINGAHIDEAVANAIETTKASIEGAY